MPEYSNGKIYTIRCKTDESLIYVGSTIQPLHKRLHQHKSNCLKFPDYIFYKSVNNDWSNWYIELYENCPCNTREELHKREGEVIRLIGNLNKIIAGRTTKEYNVDNKEHFNEWREDNKEHLFEYRKNYREENKEKISIFLKEYRDNNKERIAELKKEWREKNRDEVNQKRRERYALKHSQAKI